jgi:hypothetical protein
MSPEIAASKMIAELLLTKQNSIAQIVIEEKRIEKGA